MKQHFLSHSTNVSPFEALYGLKPTPLVGGSYAHTTVKGVAELIENKQETYQHLKEALRKAQERIKFYADRKRSDSLSSWGLDVPQTQTLQAEFNAHQ